MALAVQQHQLAMCLCSFLYGTSHLRDQAAEHALCISAQHTCRKEAHGDDFWVSEVKQ